MGKSSLGNSAEGKVSLSPPPPELQGAAGESGDDIGLLTVLPFRCYQTVIDARRNLYLLTHKDCLMLSFKEECQKALEWIGKCVSVCAGNPAESRLDCYNRYEASLEDLEQIFRGALSEVGELSEESDFLRFDLDLLLKVIDVSDGQRAVFDKLRIMRTITFEKPELAAQGLENAGLVPEGTAWALIKLDAIEEDLKSAMKRLQLKLDQYHERKAEEKKVVKEPQEDELIMLTGAAKLLGVDRGTVSRWADEGKIKDNKQKGRRRRVSKISVLLLKDKREREDLRRDAAEDLQDIASKIPDRH
jgi:excisionase family DNA binding protein